MKALLALPVLLLAVVGGAWGFLRDSLPQLDGEAALAGLGAPVTVARDSLGVVRITAATRADAARALGFVHAQERFFQMDLLRRAGAGELSALLGVADARRRPRAAPAPLPPPRPRGARRAARADDRAVLDAYVAGVNAGLAGLGARPFEYAVLREAPAPWRPEDTILVGYAMFLDLQRGGLDEEIETRRRARRPSRRPSPASSTRPATPTTRRSIGERAHARPACPRPTRSAATAPGRVDGAAPQDDRP